MYSYFQGTERANPSMQFTLLHQAGTKSTKGTGYADKNILLNPNKKLAVQNNKYTVLRIKDPTTIKNFC